MRLSARVCSCVTTPSRFALLRCFASNTKGRLRHVPLNRLRLLLVVAYEFACPTWRSTANSSGSCLSPLCPRPVILQRPRRFAQSGARRPVPGSCIAFLAYGPGFTYQPHFGGDSLTLYRSRPYALTRHLKPVSSFFHVASVIVASSFPAPSPREHSERRLRAALLIFLSRTPLM
jgi:hypothetical protein